MALRSRLSKSAHGGEFILKGAIVGKSLLVHRKTR
jgi:hypothetical protein